MREIIANIEDVEVRVAVLEDGVLVNLFIERSEPVAGNIYKGRVTNVLPGMEAAFIDIGLERNAFLHVDDIRAQRLDGEELEAPLGKGVITERLRPGQEILVQVTKEPMGSKGARVTTYLALPAHYLVLMPTVNYVGVSRRITSEAERKRLRQIADRVRPDGMGVIVRTAAEGATEAMLADDVAFLQQLWQRVLERARQQRAPALIYQDLRLIRRIVRDLFTDEVDRFVVDSPEEFSRIADLLGSFAPHLKDRLVLYREPEPVFEKFGIEREIDRALRRRVWLKSGGHIVFDRTEALTVIDVNTGKYVGKTDLASTILRTNLEAVDEIIRQIMLRDLGGIILVDFIDMEKEEHRQQVLDALHRAAQRDRARLHIIDLTALGLVEITRKRVYQDLEEIMRTPCPYCEGRGRVIAAETMAMRVRRELRKLARTSKAAAILVEVHPQVAGALFRDGAGWLRALEEAHGRRLRVKGREGLHIERLNVLEGDRLDDLEAGAAARRLQFWVDREPGEVLSLADRDPAYDLALAMAAGTAAGVTTAGGEAPRRDRLVARVLRRLLGRNGS
ncbi:MAG: Rne/Rng family ribonuclease [Armatimonadota bacterium]|nr:Rne/Rng family ribonuclease [Armatimonadota bacterium]MDR7536436.1 Rne/Rng family ribonuclease [Armatimonadota bacterium]